MSITGIVVPGRIVFVMKSDTGKLEEKHENYFDLSGGDHTIIPLNKLTPEKAPESQPKSVDNASRFMGMAARGEMGKRKPITVVAHGSGYKVKDGNATYGAAMRHGWSSLPCKIEGATDAQVSKAVALAIRLRANPAHAERFSLAKAEPNVPEAYKPKPLFTPHEMSLPKPVHSHPAATVPDLYKHAPETNAALESALSGFAAAHGGKHVPAPPSGGGHEENKAWEATQSAALGHNGPVTMMGPMKKQTRVEQKISEDRAKGEKAEPSGILDIARSTVTAPKHADFHTLLPAFRQHMADHGFELARVKDKYQQPQADGYRGVLTNWRHKNGHVAEVQFNDADLETAKPAGHKMLEQIRDINEGALKAGREPNEAERAKIHDLNQQQKAHYEGAWNKQLQRHAGTFQKSVRFAAKKLVKQAGNVVHNRWENRRMQDTGRKYYLHETLTAERPAYTDKSGFPRVLGANGKWNPTADHKFWHNSEQIDEKRFKEAVQKQGGQLPG